MNKYRFEYGKVYEWSEAHEAYLYNGSVLAFTASEIRSMKKAQDKFDAVYTREGFKIYIRNDNGVMRIVKTTFGK